MGGRASVGGLIAAFGFVLAVGAARAEPLAPLPPLPASPPEQVALGRLLFFDTRLSGDASISCASCHDPRKAWGDGKPLSTGYPGAEYFRNAQTLLNAAHYRRSYWDGRMDGRDLPTLVRDHLTEPALMQVDGRLFPERLKQVPEYDAMFRRVFGGEPTFGRSLNAVAAFVRTLTSRGAPLDRYLEGDTAALSPAARDGLALFQGKAGCLRCHDGPLLSDQKFHALGVQDSAAVFGEPLRHITFRWFMKTLGTPNYTNLREDVGRYAVTKEPPDRGRFRTPSLRDVALTAPYMHNGTLATLEEVVEFYNRGGGIHRNKSPLLAPLGLGAAEKKALVEFLEALTGEPVVVDPLAPPEYKLRALGKGSPAPAGLVAASTGTAQSGKFRALGPLGPVPVPRDNPMSDAKVELGKFLFFDPRLSGDVSTPCVACHNPEAGWGDGSDVSRGYPGTQHWRNSQTVLNAAYYFKLFWAGEVTSLEAQAVAAATGNVAGNGDPMMMEERLRQIPEYVRRFKAVFGTEQPRIMDAWKAIAAFERTLVSKPEQVPFDRFVKGDPKAITDEARRGLALFLGKAGCIQCHNGPLLSDDDYHALGVPKNPVFEEDPLRQITLRFQHVIRGVPEELYRVADRDLGLYYTTKREADRGKFRTPGLRELKYTAPYMHNGAFFTLEEVIDFYERGGDDDPNKSPLLRALKLTAQEKKDLLAFLLSLSSDQPIVVPAPQLPEYAVVK